MKIVNTGILKNPLNWLIVLLMLILAGTAGHLAMTWFGHEPASSNSNSQL